MSPLDRVHDQRHRAESFGGVAAAYDRFRPSYPRALIDDLVAGAPREALDIGCGTGKVARLLAERGVDVLGVEIDAQMADVARQAGLEVEVSSFEDWEPRGRSFDLVVSGQAWHWIEPAAGVPKLVRLLRPDATLGLFWNTLRVAEPLRTELRALYRERAPQNLAEGRTFDDKTEPPYAQDLRASGCFGVVETRHYPWDYTYTTYEWTQLVLTHSDHVVMAPDERAALVAAAAEVIERHGGKVPAHYVTKAIVARPLG